MSVASIYSLIGVYLLLLFLVAYGSTRRKRTAVWLRRSAWVYALSLALYCTAWTFYGSIGNAAEGGLSYIGVYLGPTLLAPLWGFFLVKMIRISKHLRITSVADFISSRYGRSATIGILVSIFSVIIVIPYISIQLKALAFSTSLLVDGPGMSSLISDTPVYKDPAFGFAMAFALFSIFFGTIRLDPNEKHPGLVNTLAFESLVKLTAFLIGAIAIIFIVFSGPQAIFEGIRTIPELNELGSIGRDRLPYSTWVTIFLLSAVAFILLPRQFHIAIVENHNTEHVHQATWRVPLYFFAISILVIPVAFAGKLLMAPNVAPDTYLLSIPIHEGLWVVGMIVFLGGLAAASGMVIVSLLSLSIMVSNNILLPSLLKYQTQFRYFLRDLNIRLLELRRLVIVIIAILAYAFYKLFTVHYSLVSVGLISFAGVAQFAPMVFLGMYWKKANRKGAISGLLLGMGLWAYTLAIPELVTQGFFSDTLLTKGPWSIAWLKPHALFGLTSLPPIPHGTFWSLTVNLFTFSLISILTKPMPLEVAQSDVFIQPEKYLKYRSSQLTPMRREARADELKTTLSHILTASRVQKIYSNYYGSKRQPEGEEKVSSDFIDHVESYLNGAIGSASSRIVLNYIVTNKTIKVEELLEMLDQTKQVIEYSKRLEAQTDELDKSAKALHDANTQLLELDEMKNEFISNITHELRTPITSIRSLAQIMREHNTSPEERSKFLKIIQEEAVRVSDLVNQVLDLRKMEQKQQLVLQPISINKAILEVADVLSTQFNGRSIEWTADDALVLAEEAKLKQILINLMSNAAKFTDPNTGHVKIDISPMDDFVDISVADNGIGIPTDQLPKIFDRFYQVQDAQMGKPKGSGLGLPISRMLAEKMGGSLSVRSTEGEGSTFTLSLRKA